MEHRRGAGGIPRKTWTQKVQAELKRLSPAQLQELRAHMQQELTAFLNAPEGETNLDPRDELEIRRSALGMVALQSMIRALQWIPSIERAARTIASLDDEYMPGGPPQSPVHDTLFMTWSCVDMTVGRTEDTVAALALALAPTLGWSAEVIDAVRTMAESRLGIFRILEVEPARIGDGSILAVRELVTDRRLAFQLFEAFDVHAGELILARPVVLPASSAQRRGVSHGLFATPYLLHGHSDPEWTDYLEREAAELKVRLDPAVYEQIMRGRGNDRRWLEFVVDGYVGQRKHNLVELRGIPDRPETLPEHTDHDPDEAFTLPPGASSQERANILSRKIARMFDTLADRERDEDRQAMAAHFRALQARGVDLQLCAELLVPVMMYEGSPVGGPAWIDALCEAGSLDADTLEYVQAARSAVTSIYEVLEVDEGKSLRLRDVFDGREVVVQERSGSTGAPSRILVLARVARYREIHLLEGMLPQVAGPSLRAPLLARVAQECPVPLPPAPRARGWVYPAMLVWFDVLAEERRRQPVRPTLVTSSGERVAPSKVVFGYADRDRMKIMDALQRLRGCELDGGDSEAVVFRVLRRDVLEGRILLGGSTLTIEANSVERLGRIRSRIAKKLPGVLQVLDRQTQSIEDLLATAPPPVFEPPAAEARAAVAQFIAQRYDTFLDEPIPALDGLSPRMAAARPDMRERLDALLREHEFAVTRQVGRGVVDFAVLRRELGLES